MASLTVAMTDGLTAASNRPQTPSSSHPSPFNDLPDLDGTTLPNCSINDSTGPATRPINARKLLVSKAISYEALYSTLKTRLIRTQKYNKVLRGTSTSN